MIPYGAVTVIGVPELSEIERFSERQSYPLLWPVDSGQRRCLGHSCMSGIG